MVKKFLELGGIGNFYESDEFEAASKGKERVAPYHGAMRTAALAHTTEEWMSLGEKHRLPVMRANTLEGILDDPHLKAVEFLKVREYATEGAWRSVEPPIQFSKTPTSVRIDPQKPGASNGLIFNAEKKN